MVFFLGFACVLGGFIMVLPLLKEKKSGLRTFEEKVSPYKIIIGLAVLIIGVITFIVPYHKSGRPLVPIFGDFIPSVFAMLSGIFISIDFLESLKGFQGKFTQKLKVTVQKHPFPIGFAAIFFGILHWILFRIVFF